MVYLVDVYTVEQQIAVAQTDAFAIATYMAVVALAVRFAAYIVVAPAGSSAHADSVKCAVVATALK